MTGGQALRPFRYLRLPLQDRELVHLVSERVKCGTSLAADFSPSETLDSPRTS
jgi:hypothetical protein